MNHPLIMDAREFGLCLLQLWFLFCAFQFEWSSKMAKKWRTTLHNRKNISLGFWSFDSITNSKQLNTYRFWILESVDHQTLEHCIITLQKNDPIWRGFLWEWILGPKPNMVYLQPWFHTMFSQNHFGLVSNFYPLFLFH